MIYRFLADVTVVIHFGYVLFVILGLLVTLLGWMCGWSWIRNRWFRTIHLAMILIVVFEAWAGITCPLTTLEKEFRRAAGEQVAAGSFIANWVHNAMFFEAPPWVFTLCYTLFGGLVLATLIAVPPRWRPESGKPA